MTLAPATAHGQEDGGEYCLTADPPPASAEPRELRFGTTPLTAGSAGPNQLEPVPHEPERDVDAVQRLRPDGTELVMRLNRMFWADGRGGIERYAAIVDRYAEAGFPSELQVRYHPPEGQEGDMAAWEAYVREAARILGTRRAVTGLSITNEANFTASPNTSDGSYEGAREAIVVGTLAARDELDRMGRRDVALGFSFAWRWMPDQDREFWEELGRLGGPEFVAATDHVGLQVYPHHVWPTVELPDRSAGEEVVEALHLLRNCYMPKAGLGDVDLWVTENGYHTNLDGSEEEQDAKLLDTVEHVHAWSGTLGVTDYRWFNLRDNDTDGPDLFDAVGLLRDDYSEKPAFSTFRTLLATYGADADRAAPAGRRGEGADTGERPGPAAGDAGPLPATGGTTGAWGAGVALTLVGLRLRRHGRAH